LKWLPAIHRDRDKLANVAWLFVRNHARFTLWRSHLVLKKIPSDRAIERTPRQPSLGWTLVFKPLKD
jgi:hypothetical protein